MNPSRAPHCITFDTNLAGVWNTRVFWATLCEEIGQAMVLTPTATTEVLRRVRLETEREWTKKLRGLNREQALGWTKVEVRRLATVASVAARDWLGAEVRKQGSIYAASPRSSTQTESLEAEIEEMIDDRAFDLSTDNGIRDRKIVIEAMARGFHILASNNVDSIDHGMLRQWLRNAGGPRLGLSTTILRPEPAEEEIRTALDKSIEWTAHAAARACVTDPDDELRSAREIAELIEGFDERGMSELKGRIYRMTKSRRELAQVLESVTRHGASRAMRGERALREAGAKAASRRAGMSLSM